jgi:hypothetical protein
MAAQGALVGQLIREHGWGWGAVAIVLCLILIWWSK